MLAEAFSRPRELHATLYGVAIGYAASCDAGPVRLALLGVLFGGGNALDVEGKPARELQSERQYAILGVGLGVTLHYVVHGSDFEFVPAR